MISVIVPVYNVEPYIHQCIDSIINQTYKDLEVLLIDDGSPDNCGQICDDYAKRDQRIKVFHTENRGLSAARNLGLQHAKGDYIGFVDSDDWIEPDMYEVLLSTLTNEDADMTICGFFRESEKATNAVDYLKKVYMGNDAVLVLLEGKINSNVWNRLYKKELFKSVLFPNGKNYEDVAIMHVIMHNSNKIVLTDMRCYHYRLRLESITKTYTANNLIDYANAYLSRYYYFKENDVAFFCEHENLLLELAVVGISRIWRWWYGCTKEEKKRYSLQIKKYKSFVKDNFSMLGNQTWPLFMRVSIPFMYFDNYLSFRVLYFINQMYRILIHQCLESK